MRIVKVFWALDASLAQHPGLPVVLRVRVDVHKGILLEKILPEHLGDLKGDLVFGRQGVLTHQLYNLVQVGLLLEGRHSPLPVEEKGLRRGGDRRLNLPLGRGSA